MPGPSPELAVVVPSVSGLHDLTKALRALEAERASDRIEVIVVDRLGELERAQIVQAFPWVNVVAVAPGTPIPQMRAAGVERTVAPAIAVIEDHVVVRPGWARALLDALTGATPVVGGALDNGATDTTADWAAFLCEYSHCLPPLPSGGVSWLPGNNTVYAREVLVRHLDLLRAGAWEDELHRAILSDGLPLTARPDIIVDHVKHVSVGEYASQRFLYSRAYAGRRGEGRNLARRAALAVRSFPLPVVLFLRITRRVAARGRYRRKLASTLPLLALFSVVWAAGEFVGYVAGAGNSLSKVR